MLNYILNVIIIMVIATAITRLIPLCMPEKYYNSIFLKDLNKFFPAVILTLLVIYSIKDANWGLSYLKSKNFAFAELFGILSTVLIHSYKRNAFLSIGIGTATYILSKNIIY